MKKFLKWDSKLCFVRKYTTYVNDRKNIKKNELLFEGYSTCLCLAVPYSLSVDRG